MPPTPTPTRWRVLLTRLPAAHREAIQAAFPRPRELRDNDLPLIVQVASSLLDAQRTANRLRSAGAVVIVVEESEQQDAFCTQHPVRYTEACCRICQRPICVVCVQEAEGEALCVTHAQLRRRRKRFLRLRQLFLLFLLTVFVYEISRAVQVDKERVDPLGTVSVALHQFVAPGLEGAPIIAKLNGVSSPYSLRGISGWYDDEYARYTNRNQEYIRLTILPPVVREIAPPDLATPDASWWRVSLRAWQYLHYFETLAERNSPQGEEFGSQIVVIYASQDDDLAAHSRGSERGRLAVSYIDVTEQNPAYALVTVAHELAHTLGAEDTYDPDTSLAKHPYGFVEPFANPLYPQRFAELMAVDVPIGPGLEGEIRSLSQVRVGYHTAALMGWLSSEQADLFYTPPGLKPEDHLPPREPPAPPSPQ